MIQELEAIKEAWSPDDADQRQDALARTLADNYVSENAAFYADEDYGSKSVAELVRKVDTYREAGDENAQWKVEAWLLHRYNPQNIGGQAEPAVRIPNNG